MLDAKIPSKLEINDETLSQYLNTLTFATTQPLFVIQENNRAILIHGLPSDPNEIRLKDVCYDFVGIILTEGDINDIPACQVLLHVIAEEIKSFEPKKRKKIFETLIQKYAHNNTRKIVFLGLPDSGKTTTQQFLAQKIQDDSFLKTTFQPTVGVEISNQKLLDLDFSLFDTSGQELDRWLEADSDVLEYSEIIIFFFSVSYWQTQRENVIHTLTKFENYVHKLKNKPQIYVFCHKFDLIQENADSLKFEIRNALKELDLWIFFTSLKGGGNAEFLMAMQQILSNFSSIYNYISQIVKKIQKQVHAEPILFLENYKLQPLCDLNIEQNTQYFAIIKKIVPSLTLFFENQLKEKLNYSILQSESFNKLILNCVLTNFILLDLKIPVITFLVNSLEDCQLILKNISEIKESNNWNVKK